MGSRPGAIISLQICPGHGKAMRGVDPVEFVADRGILGCSHARTGSRRQVLLIESETLQEFGLAPGTVKENVTTRGIDLTSLTVDTRLRLGSEVELWVTGACHPCSFMDEIRDGLQEEIRGRRGVLAWVKRGGRVNVGDEIEVIPR